MSESVEYILTGITPLLRKTTTDWRPTTVTEILPVTLGYE
jgi:hypothetical protein